MSAAIHIRSIVAVALLLSGSATHAEPSASEVVKLIDQQNLVALMSLNGLVNGFGYANAEFKLRGLEQMYCQPDKLALTPDQAASILKKFVGAHPDTAGRPYGAVALIALEEAFPC